MNDDGLQRLGYLTNVNPFLQLSLLSWFILLLVRE